MEDVAGKLAEQIKGTVSKHPDILWALPLITAARFTSNALKDAKDKKGASAVMNTLGAVASLVSATNGLRLSESIRHKPKKAVISDETKQRILEAIAEYRAKKTNI